MLFTRIVRHIDLSTSNDGLACMGGACDHYHHLSTQPFKYQIGLTALYHKTHIRTIPLEYVALEVIERICAVLHCQPGEIIECVANPPE